MATDAATRNLASLSFYQGTGKPKNLDFLKLQKPNVSENNSNNNSNSMTPHVKKQEQMHKFVNNTNINQVY